MIVECVDLVAEWLADGTNGVNALLPAVPRKAGDVQPASLAAILAETRNGEVARGKFPQATTSYPALVVTVEGDIAIPPDVRTAKWEALVPVSMLYAVRQVASELGTRDAGYTLRAVLRSIWKLEDPANAAARVRNNITLQGIERIDWLASAAELEDVVVLGGVRVVWRVVDTQPGG